MTVLLEPTAPASRQLRTPSRDYIDVPVHYRHHADGTWTYRIDSPSVRGGTYPSREEAERYAVAALARALAADRHAPEQDEVVGHVTLELRAVW